MRNGGCDFVQKPWNNRNLIDTLRLNVVRAKAKREKQEKAAADVGRDLEEARQTQQRLLPALMPRVSGVDIQTAWLPAYEQALASLNLRDRLLLLTDGITEASNPSGEQFGDGGRIADLLARNRRLTSQQLKDTLLDAVASFGHQNLQDDAALMVLSL